MSNIPPASVPVTTPLNPRPAVSLPSRPRRRDKPQLSCTLCRRRKLKCDRNQPCGTCIRRGLSLSCTYIRFAPDRSDPSQGPPVASAAMQERITQLEGLVVSLMSSLNATKLAEQTPPAESADLSMRSSPGGQNEANETASPSDPAQTSPNPERNNLESSEASYDESANWTAIIDGIGALKDHFENHSNPTDHQQPQPTKFPDAEGPDLIFGGHGSATKQEILSAIPSRPVVDRLVAKCFACMEMASVIIHSPTFLKEYERFWDNPMGAPLMWIGLLFGIMCSATLYQQLSPNESAQLHDPQSASDSTRLAQLYRAKTIQCIVLRGYNQPVPYTIETFLLYLHADSLSSRDTQTQFWLILGLIVRVAQRMGYHRDATRYPGISPFQAEMRRRVWTVIIQLEVIASAHCGLPRMLRDIQCDAAEPRNLLDEDFDENMVELPPARPSTSFTPVQYFVAKNKIISALGLIIDFDTSTQPCPYTEVMRLDGILHEAYDSLPYWLLMRPMSQLIMDSADAIMRRVSTALLYNRARCVLHRNYLASAWTVSSHGYSRTACIEAALEILKIQQILDQETKPGGRLHQERWKILSLTKTDFVFATNILCLELEHDIFERSAPGSIDAGTNGVLMQALADSRQIWLLSSNQSKEAKKAVEILNAVLGKAHDMATKSKTAAAGYAPSPARDSSKTLTDTPSTTTANPPQQPIPRYYQGVLAPLMDMYDRVPQSAEPFAETGADPFDFDDWDSGYQSQSIDEMTGMSLNYPLMFGFHR